MTFTFYVDAWCGVPILLELSRTPLPDTPAAGQEQCGTAGNAEHPFTAAITRQTCRMRAFESELQTIRSDLFEEVEGGFPLSDRVIQEAEQLYEQQQFPVQDDAQTTLLLDAVWKGFCFLSAGCLWKNRRRVAAAVRKRYGDSVPLEQARSSADLAIWRVARKYRDFPLWPLKRQLAAAKKTARHDAYTWMVKNGIAVPKNRRKRPTITSVENPDSMSFGGGARWNGEILESVCQISSEPRWGTHNLSTDEMIAFLMDGLRRRLRPKGFTVAELMFREGFGRGRIARLLGMKLATARRLVARVRRICRELVREVCE